tara:strand:+ start:4002 stop:5444 length:1443 start_codon:yes stop_codon:yes gene_type:complete
MSTYGAGTATQFSDGTQRQVLELGPKIYYYNESVTPLLSISGRAGAVQTPVPIYEWMEDEYFIKRSVKTPIVSTDVADTATGGINGHHTVVKFRRQAQMEMFEVGAIYAASVAGGSAALQTAVTHFLCVAIGKGVNLSSPTDKHVQFVGLHIKSSDSTVYQVEQCADGSDLITADASGILTLTYVATAGQYGTTANYASQGLFQAETAFLDDNEFKVAGGNGTYAEGAAVGSETRKKVRRLSNCTQIFREPYTITRTARVSEQYGGPELARLQARKLAQIKANVEYAMLFNGAKSLDSSSANPQRTFAGLGVGGSTGVIQTNNADVDSSLQFANSGGTQAQFDAVIEHIFQDTMDGSMEKTVFASNKWLLKMTAMVRADSSSNMNAMMGEEEKAGLRVMSYMGPVGTLNFVPHPMLRGAYEDYAVAVDFANFDARVLAESDFQLRRDIVQDGSDGQTDEWLVELGPEIRQEQTHAIMKLV